MSAQPGHSVRFAGHQVMNVTYQQPHQLHWHLLSNVQQHVQSRCSSQEGTKQSVTRVTAFRACAVTHSHFPVNISWLTAVKYHPQLVCRTHPLHTHPLQPPPRRLASKCRCDRSCSVDSRFRW